MTGSPSPSTLGRSRSRVHRRRGRGRCRSGWRRRVPAGDGRRGSAPLGAVADTSTGCGRQAADGHRLADELGDEQLLEVQPDRAGVEAGDLEQVLDESLEPDHVARPAGRAPPGPARASRRGGPASPRRDAASVINGERSSWLTSRGEPGVALDPLLQRFGHVVERRRSACRRSGSSVVSRRVSSRPPAIALAAWAASPPGVTARRAANDARQHAEQGRDQRRRTPGESRDAAQRRLGLVETEELEVGTDAWHVRADDRCRAWSPTMAIWLAGVRSLITFATSAGGISDSGVERRADRDAQSSPDRSSRSLHSGHGRAESIDALRGRRVRSRCLASATSWALLPRRCWMRSRWSMQLLRVKRRRLSSETPTGINAPR